MRAILVLTLNELPKNELPKYICLGRAGVIWNVSCSRHFVTPNVVVSILSPSKIR